MSPESILDIAQSAITTLLLVVGPLMMIALVVGLIISLFQALTSIQEMTLTFVPKIILVFGSLLFLLPWMAEKLRVFADIIFDRIVNQGL